MQKIDIQSIQKSVVDSSNRSFCVLPFVGLTGDQNGSYRLCCEDTSIRYDSKLGNIQYQSISEMKNGDYVSRVRKNMLEGIENPECSVCYEKERLHLKSMRQTFNDKYSDRLEYILRNTDISTGRTDCDIYYLDIRFSNLCNLSCRMCWSGSSTGRAEIDKKLGRTNYDQYYAEIWDNKEIFDPQGPLKNIETIYVAGGEPFMDTTFIKFLKFLIEEKETSKIVLKINTNLTILPKKYLSLLQHFKKVEFIASCDGYDKMYEYIRIGGKWDLFVKNLITLIQFLPQLGKGSRIDMNTVVQIDNISNIPKLYLLCNKLGIRIIFSILHSPKNMFIGNIPDDQKKGIIDLYQTYINKYKTTIEKIEKDFGKIIHILETEKQDRELYKSFQEEKEIIDSYANLSVVK